MVNNSLSPIPKFEENNKNYTAHDVKRADSARRFHNIKDQPIKQILHAVDNKILHNIPIFENISGWLRTSMDPVCHIYRKK